ncbi:MAG TPA: AMP-binding protein, partial [Desulfobacterales bacterium]|nr:AMP-binding protein [Desulfobacterales bacterium]
MAELSGKTLGQFFMERVAARGDRVALREKDLGIWQRVTWNQYLEHVRSFALGLKALGFDRGNHLAIVSENRREWLYADIATVCLGGVTVGVYPTSPSAEVRYVIQHSDSRFVVCEDQEQTDKILEVIDDLPQVAKIIVADMKGMRRYPRERIVSFAEVEDRGRELLAREPGLFQQELAQGRPEDVAIIVYTSGTTGPPKGAMISHANVEAMTAATVEAIG